MVDLLDRGGSGDWLNRADTAAVAVEISAADRSPPRRATDSTSDIEAIARLPDPRRIRRYEQLLASLEQAPTRLYRQLADALRHWGRLESARAVVRQGLIEHPQSAELHHLCGDLALTLGQTDLARSHARAACAAGHDQAEHWALLGHVYAAEGVHTKAIDALQQALATQADNFWRQSLANSLIQAGCFDEAVAAWRQVVSERPFRLQPMMGLARALRAAGQSVEAVGLCRQAIAYNPDAAAAYALGMQLLCDLDEPAEALALHEQAPPEIAGSASLQQFRDKALKRLGRSAGPIVRVRPRLLAEIRRRDLGARSVPSAARSRLAPTSVVSAPKARTKNGVRAKNGVLYFARAQRKTGITVTRIKQLRITVTQLRITLTQLRITITVITVTQLR